MAEFNVGGTWSLQQSNGFTVKLKLRQDGSSLNGKGSTTGMIGAAKGSVSGDQFVVTIDWDNSGPGRGGEYIGSFAPNGRLHGITVDLDHPASSATWFSNEVFRRG